MVDVRDVIEVGYGGAIDLTGKVLFAPMWFAVHRRKENLQLKCKFNDILNSTKFSWRVMAEMLLDLEKDGVPDWARIQWVAFDLRNHTICRIPEPVGGMSYKFVLNGSEICPDKYRYGWTAKGGPGWYECDPNSEYQHNNFMMKMFGRKYPIRLVSMSPFSGDVTVNVPVVETSGGQLSDKMKQVYRMAGR